MAEKTTLSSADVAKLLQDPSGENRAVAASKVASTFSADSLSDKEREIAESIFRHMLKDAEVRVRQALSESLKENPEVPHDVASALAKDVDEVAMPLIESSVVLTDADLIELVKTRGSDVQKAVAGRDDVSENLSDVIAEEGSEEAVAALVGNDSAAISDATFGKVLDKHGDSELVQGPMANRQELPVAVAERLVTLVSEQLKDHILTHHEVSPGMASDLLLESREKATVSLLDGDENTVQALVDQLHANGRLTPTLMLRALVMGDVTFFEVALAKRVNIPVVNAYKLVHDKGGMGLQRLFEAAKMPPQLLLVARSALDLFDEMLETAGDDQDMFKQLMIERVLTAVEDEIDTDNLDYLIGKLHGVQADNHVG
ncbi:DUF2336 domain-containing protein [Kordiimonas laminariae]|uniref:DUF2336 domain-containing protein n=1 Tax=Kordiimonas laminariae TaxID=2917717 RepID=UPI001FF605A2|nr:DUF2336 domain-containing protein [Kordiimonas laminariae]MCK0070512.1 DUF2336 domain-containing protein [Kordiimonas laminariae]